MLRHHHRCRPLFNRPAKSNPLGHRRLSTSVCSLHGALYRRWVSDRVSGGIDPGWGITLETVALFLIVEFIIGQAVEPWLYGHQTGISPIAVVVSATFWTWLWGPVGLVLSTPLTVCLVVLGRHVERLAFLDVIFGDAPPLTAVETFYQRMLAGDASEVVDQAEEYLKNHSLADYYDNVALKALLMAQIDLCRGVLDELGASKSWKRSARSSRIFPTIARTHH